MGAVPHLKIFPLALIIARFMGKIGLGRSKPNNPFHRSVTNVENNIKRGDIYYADLSPVAASRAACGRYLLCKIM